MPFDELVALSAELDTMLRQIRFERTIRPPVIRSHTAVTSEKPPNPM